MSSLFDAVTARSRSVLSETHRTATTSASAAIRKTPKDLIVAGLGFEIDSEQQAIAEAKGPLVVGKAYAGTGKTTTARAHAYMRPGDKILYLPFGSANAAEARRLFPSNVECRTTHSLAYLSMPKSVKDRVPVAGRSGTGGAPMHTQFRALDISKAFGVPYRVAAIAYAGLSAFFYSEDDQVPMAHHLASIDPKLNPSEYEKDRALIVMQDAWKRMLDRNDTFPIPHDAYLKMYANAKPLLDYDWIYLDEAQDINPVTMSIILRQKKARILVIGDEHQSIYAFRNAKNVIPRFLANPISQEFYLTHSRRFGPKTATLANAILHEFKGDKSTIHGAGKDGVFDASKQVAFLSRTNARLIQMAADRQGVGMHWLGGLHRYALDEAVDAYALYKGRLREIKSPFLRRFVAWSDLVQYGDQTKDKDAASLVRLIDAHKDDIPEIIDLIKRNAVPNREDADRILTTIHFAKGLEFDQVEMDDKFEWVGDARCDLKDSGRLSTSTEQDVNLAYVGVTRAKTAVRLGGEMLDWAMERDLPWAENHVPVAYTESIPNRNRAKA